MIARLRGEVLEAGGSPIVVLCHGVGYEVHVPHSVLVEHALPGEPIDLYTRLVIREDEHTLYGFGNARQRALFEMLREVKGCGAKISLALISTLGEGGAVEAIASQNSKSLATTPGIGTRLAERIILELKEKVLELHSAIGGHDAHIPAKPLPQDDPLAEALLALGYRRQEFEEAAAQAREATGDLGEQVRHALRSLKK
ncbi:MAG: Holliday junction branch migration protein RuvA [Armatimonadetes bacterium]|nr:Holliday junction branch migration protein RuvA [Armatimonadota bacterium]MBS1711038.1 Holliday junction branch migration protein RuvA [Armatimonadota bacterium]MBX3108710.1 Holliday junction branch migration protein RuvA [Fimbriimonadaceae bacterium]